MTLKEFKETVKALENTGLHDLTPVVVDFKGFFADLRVQKIDVEQAGGTRVIVSIGQPE